MTPAPASSPDTEVSPAACLTDDERRHPALLPLTLGAIGVVFGDIGTSPIYAFREALGQSGGIDRATILGVLSLSLWSLILVVSGQYVLFLMRVDNAGEGGVLAMSALARRTAARRAGVSLLLGAVGAALLCGDAILTPSLSVLSAVEGLRSVPATATLFDEGALRGITVAVLVALFVVQSRNLAYAARLFGPVYLLWFVAIGVLGVRQVAAHPDILAAFSPGYGIAYLASHGMTALFVLGAVFLTVTGAESMLANLGHFGRTPIRLGWFALILPSLALSYLGQGAYAAAALDGAAIRGEAMANADWFFLLAPDTVRLPLVLLAAVTTLIASQTIITGAFQLTQQAVQLGLLPRLRVRRTSAQFAGQVYLPTINWLLLIGVMGLIVRYRTSSDMAAAYGIAVSGTTLVSILIAWLVVRRTWGWPAWRAAAIVGPLAVIDAVFFVANMLRMVEGGWIALLVAAAVGLAIFTWVRGSALVRAYEGRQAIPLADLAAALAQRPPERVDGTAVFLTGNTDEAPAALLHNLKHNKILHRHNVVCSIRTADRPTVAAADRARVERVDDNFTAVVLTYGFMESPDVPSDLGMGGSGEARGLDPMRTSFFIGRNTIKPDPEQGMPMWQDRLFVFLQKNASDPTEFLNIPPGKVVELGEQVAV